VLSAGAKKKALYLGKFGRSLFPMDRMRRETFYLEKQQPSVHQDSLQKYLQVSKHLMPQVNSKLLRPIIRHPDLRPSNIFVSDDFEITSLIDWQSSVILPLCLQSGIQPTWTIPQIPPRGRWRPLLRLK
jgi:aminoglycoside phosphotransferase (APT) family kinase protein